MYKRTLVELLNKHHFIHDKMAFISGPRQAGKTTLAKNLLKDRGLLQLYYNWDDFLQKKELMADPYVFEKKIPLKKGTPLIVFDEIQKYNRWKNYLKSVYDRYHEGLQILVTGSGRLNHYKKGADSLLGRFFSYQMLPLTLGELIHNQLPSFEALFEDYSNSTSHLRATYEQLAAYSGFPQPFSKATKSFLRRWQNEHKELILRQDVRDLTNVREIDLMSGLIMNLPEKIGSPFSINSMTTDVPASFKTVQNWILILKELYFLFQISPYSKKIKNTLKKEKKLYFWDWSVLVDAGKRFENIVAAHLKKYVSMMQDFGLGDVDLFYIRDKQKNEVDFVITNEGRPEILIETKLQDQSLAKSLLYFMRSMKVKTAFQVIETPGIHYVRKTTEGSVHVISVEIFLNNFA